MQPLTIFLNLAQPVVFIQYSMEDTEEEAKGVLEEVINTS